MSGVWSQLRARATAAVVSTAGSGPMSDAAALAADMAARPWDYEIPAFALKAHAFVLWLRSKDARAVEFKRKLAAVLLVAGGASFVLRMWKLHKARSAKAAALAQRARDAAAGSGAVLALSPSPDSASDEDKPSLGDRLLHIPDDNGALPVPEPDKQRKSGKGSTEVVKAAAEGKDGVKKHRVAVDALFFARLGRILRICVPGLYTTEALYIAILTVLLFARTAFSIYIAELVGSNAQSLVARRWGRMWRGIKAFAVITIPASAVNAGLKYFTDMVALRFRKRLSEHVCEVYLDGSNFYKAVNLGGDARIDNADQRVTSDIKDFSDEIASLYASLLKPLLDVVLFTWKLGSLLGWQGPAAMHSYFILSGFVKKKVMPHLGQMVARESELEGFYRAAHGRLITNSEEIAFYDGSKKEKVIITSALQLLCKHIAYHRYVKACVAVFDGLLVKYYASIAGYCTLLSPFIFAKNTGSTTAELTRDYIRNSQYLGQLSTAVAALVMVGNKLTSIAGYTSRVSELLEQVRHLNEAGNEPFEIKPEVPHVAEDVQQGSEYADTIARWRKRCDEQRELRYEIRHSQATSAAAKARNSSERGSGSQCSVGASGGTIERAEDIEFKGVDIVSPEGKLLVHDLNFTVKQGENVMVTGPNGVGKSSLFRIIGELWPLHSGVLRKPAKEEIMFIPQKPYLVLGSLRDQIIYPHEYADMQRLGVTDDDLAALLAIVDPARNITTEWQWDTVKDWFHAFSGGQKQRVAMARLFYHKPKFAILDECTSAVSDEVEGTIYSTCRALGITIFTVSHRPSLAKYHDVVLKFEGFGRWSTQQIDSRAELERAAQEKERSSASIGSSKAPAAGSKGPQANASTSSASAVAPAASSSVTPAAAAVEPEPAAPATAEEAAVSKAAEEVAADAVADGAHEEAEENGAAAAEQSQNQQHRGKKHKKHGGKH